MLGLFGKRKAASAASIETPASTVQSPQQIAAFVFVDDMIVPDFAAAAARAKQLWPGMPHTEKKIDPTGAGVMVGGGAFCTTMFVKAKYPVGELQNEVSQAMGWPTVIDDLNRHQAHVLLSASHPDPVTAHMLLSHLVAAVLEQTGAAGVLWANTGNLIPADSFIGQCAKTLDGEPPVLLWAKVAISDGKTADGHDSVLLHTTGLASFGLYELECPCLPDHLNLVFSFMYGTAAGALKHMQNRPNGSGVDFSEQGVKAISFHVAPSLIDGSRKVMRLQIH